MNSDPTHSAYPIEKHGEITDPIGSLLEADGGSRCRAETHIKAYVREAVAAEKAGMKVETSPPEFPVPEELKEKFPQRSAVQTRVRRADAGSAKGILVSLRQREAVWDARRADREGDANDLRRTGVLERR